MSKRKVDMVSIKVGIGDEVGYSRLDTGADQCFDAGFARVIEINRHGHITLDTGLVFDKHGKERDHAREGAGAPLELCTADDLRARLIHQADTQSKLNRAAAELEDVIKRCRDDRGNVIWPISDDARATMVWLMNQLYYQI